MTVFSKTQRQSLREAATKTIPMGHCYDWAYRQVFDDESGRIVLVHGTVTAPFSRPPHSYKHAWVEKDKVVQDWQCVASVGGGKWRGIGYPIYVFEELYQPKKTKRYTREQAIQKAMRSGHYGPWKA